MTPEHAGERGFVDASPHRAKLPSAYNGYLETGADPFYVAEREDFQMLLRPLFFTSFLIDDQLEDDGALQAGPVVVSSASSKTAIAAAFLLAQREGVELIGVTHWEEFSGGAGELPGPTPKFFFAPDRVTKRSEDWGRDGLERRVAEAWHPFVEWAAGWLRVERGEGFGDVERVYLDVLEGRVGPAIAHVLSV